jgi:hypothetical protein
MKISSLVLTSLVFSLLFAGKAQAQSNFQIKGVSGSAGVGYADFTINKPKADYDLHRGTIITASGEKGFDVLNMYLVISLNYLKTDGNSNYDYTNLSGTRYTGQNLDFNANVFQATLGLRFKLIDAYWFRPYIEAGGVGGYYTVEYQAADIASKVTPVDNEIPKKDSMVDFGYYGEGGLEIQFAERFGVRVAARLEKTETQKIKTLANQTVNYDTHIYYFALLAQF